MDDDQQQLAPPVVVVTITAGAAPELDATLRSIARQSARNLTSLVLATGPVARPAEVDQNAVAAGDPLAGRVGAVLPGAFIRRCADGATWAQAANEVLRLVEGVGGYFCFVHDDAVLDPDAVEHLVDEAVRSNAAVAGPKLVLADDSRRLLAAGFGADKFGDLLARCGVGELDQEQHDAVGDVFALPDACLLVRADLFREVGGFDETMPPAPAVVDLCWRTHVAGGRVLVVPDARVAHGEVSAFDVADVAEEERSRMRSVLGNYTRAHLARVLPQLLVAAAWRLLASLVTGRLATARAIVGAWAVLLRPGAVRAKRQVVTTSRQVPDAEIRRLQIHGSARLLGLLRRRRLRDDGGVSSAVRGAGRQVAVGVRSTTTAATVVLGTYTLLVLVGARQLVRARVPVFGSFVGPGRSTTSTIRTFVHGWWAAGLGRPGPNPTGQVLAALAGMATAGNLTALRTAGVVGALVLGGIGAWRLAHPFRSNLASGAAFAVYAGAPLGVNALARGHAAGLAAYAVTPWIVRRVARLARLAPFGDVGTDLPGDTDPGTLHALAGLALLVAFVAAFAPAVLLVAPATAVALVVASPVAGGVVRSLRGFVWSSAAAALGGVLLLPWRVARPGSWFGLGALVGETDHQRLAALVRFATGPHASTVGFALAVTVIAAVLIARGDDLAWAVRGVVLAASAFAVAAAASRGHLGRTPPELEVLLAPALTGLALVSAAGASSFDSGTRGRTFSWRQPVGFAAAIAVLLAALPTIASLGSGRFGAPSGDLVAPLRFLPPADPGAGQRLLWVGSPAVLPPSAWPLATGLAYAVTDATGPSLSDLWHDDPGDGERLVAEALNLAADGRTDRIGHLLAPFGVRFVILPIAGRPSVSAVADVPSAVGSGDVNAAATPDAGALTGALAAQLDLRRVKVDERLLVYQNTAWLPTIAELDDAAAAASRQVGTDALAAADLDASPAVLNPRGEDAASGAVVRGTVYLARPYDDRWSLRVGGTGVKPSPAFGWATSFAVPEDGAAQLSYAVSPVRLLLLAAQLVGWLVVVRLALSTSPVRRRRVRTVTPADTTTRAVPASSAGARTGVGGASPAGEDELLWSGEDDAVPDGVQALRDAFALPDEIGLRWSDRGDEDDA